MSTECIELSIVTLGMNLTYSLYTTWFHLDMSWSWGVRGAGDRRRGGAGAGGGSEFGSIGEKYDFDHL